MNTGFRRGADDNYCYSGCPRTGTSGCALACGDGFGTAKAIKPPIVPNLQGR
jgi:hypothetical protein